MPPKTVAYNLNVTTILVGILLCSCSSTVPIQSARVNPQNYKVSLGVSNSASFSAELPFYRMERFLDRLEISGMAFSNIVSIYIGELNLKYNYLYNCKRSPQSSLPDFASALVFRGAYYEHGESGDNLERIKSFSFGNIISADLLKDISAFQIDISLSLGMAGSVEELYDSDFREWVDVGGSNIYSETRYSLDMPMGTIVTVKKMFSFMAGISYRLDLKREVEGFRDNFNWNIYRTIEGVIPNCGFTINFPIDSGKR